MTGGGTFGSCVQQSLVQRGILPAPEAEETVVAEPEIVEGEEVEEPAPVPADETVVATSPMIDARVEPDGSTILAGTVEPNVDIQLFFNGVEVGQTTADSAGDWIFIPDEPLPAGGVAITLRTGADGEMFVEGPEALAVVVDGESQPTVVASAPDALTQVITELTGSAPDMPGSDPAAEEEPPMEMAAIEPDDVPEVNEPETALPDADLVAPEPAAGEATDAVVEETPEPVQEPEAEQTPTPEMADEASEAPVEEEAVPAEQTEPVTPENVVEEEPMQMAAVEPEADLPEEPVTAVPPAITVEPTIDAVEIEPDGSFIAGAGQDGMTVRLFVDDRPVGESLVEGGRWLVETDEVLSEPNQRIRAVMVAPDDIVTAEAEINFVIDQGEAESPATGGDLILPADQLAPIALPTEAPLVVADAPEAAADTEAEATGDLVLPRDSLSAMSLPLEAPSIVIAEAEPDVATEPDAVSEPAQTAVGEAAEPETPSETDVAMTEQSDGQVQLPEDQLAPITLPTEAPPVEVPATPEDMQVAEVEPDNGQLILPDDQLSPISLPTEAPPMGAATQPEEVATDIEVAFGDPAAPGDGQLILPEDQLSPISLPTEAPTIDFAGPPAEASSELEVAEVEPVDPVDEQVILPEDQLAPIALPTQAPPVDVARADTAPAEMADPGDSIVTLPDDQLAPIALPTEAPEVSDVEIARGADSVITLPVDQLPAISMPDEAPPVEVAAADDPASAEPVAEDPLAEAPMVEEPAMEVAEAEPLILPEDQLPSIELPLVAPPVPATRPAVDAEMAEALPEPDMAVEEDVPAEEDVPTLVATPVGDPEDGRFASGKVIIRRGDNLWTIARRVYGRGIQYTVIYDANREKINNPDLIFPGQVFDLPETAQR